MVASAVQQYENELEGVVRDVIASGFLLAVPLLPGEHRGVRDQKPHPTEQRDGRMSQTSPNTTICGSGPCRCLDPTFALTLPSLHRPS